MSMTYNCPLKTHHTYKYNEVNKYFMRQLDRILEFLRDRRWKSVKEIKKETSIQDEPLNEVLSFLQEQSLINKENDKVRITPKGLKFLELAA